MSHLITEPKDFKDNILYLQDVAESTPCVTEIKFKYDPRDLLALKSTLWKMDFDDDVETDVFVRELEGVTIICDFK